MSGIMTDAEARQHWREVRATTIATLERLVRQLKRGVSPVQDYQLEHAASVLEPLCRIEKIGLAEKSKSRSVDVRIVITTPVTRPSRKEPRRRGR